MRTWHRITDDDSMPKMGDADDKGYVLFEKAGGRALIKWSAWSGSSSMASAYGYTHWMETGIESPPVSDDTQDRFELWVNVYGTDCYTAYGSKARCDEAAGRCVERGSLHLREVHEGDPDPDAFHELMMWITLNKLMPGAWYDAFLGMIDKCRGEST